jgi:hypothetical protein
MWPIVGNIVSAPVAVTVSIVPVIMVMPVIMVPVIVVPVVGSPWSPVGRIISIVPVGSPYNVPRGINIPDHRPGCNIVVSGGNHIHIFPVGFPGIARIWCFGIDWFDNIIRSVKCLITNQLNLNSTIPQLLHHKNSDILLLVSIQCCAKCNGMHISICIIRYCNIIYIIIAVQVEVVNCGFLVIEFSLEFFQGLRSLENIHYGIEVQIVSRKTKVFRGIVLGSSDRSCCGKDQC